MPSRPLVRSPYDVELIGADGRALATYRSGDRFYVLGQTGERYSIRVVNPTARRVEAVISVDGLDVIDGATADFASRRGYVVPPGGDLVVDGFRMSTTQVAAFRFSSVGESYAERKGKGRNIGVIGVAIFEEKEEPHPWYGDDRADATGRRDSSRHASERSSRPSADQAPATAGSSAPAKSAPVPSGRFDGDAEGGGVTRGRLAEKRQSRPGLGTEWGEERYSAVDFTTFERASRTVPTAIAELRYNDAEGLRALGIRLQPTPDLDELTRRETANPFPAAPSFASPP